MRGLGTDPVDADVQRAFAFVETSATSLSSNSDPTLPGVTYLADRLVAVQPVHVHLVHITF